jgi:hypothetical protein
MGKKTMTDGKSPNSEIKSQTAWDFEYDLYYPGSRTVETPRLDISAELKEIADGLKVRTDEGTRHSTLDSSISDGEKIEAPVGIQVCGVYAIISTSSGRQYVGSSVDVYRRRQQHLSKLKAGKHHARHLQEEFTKNGQSGFRFKILETVSNVEILRQREQYWIDISGAHKKGFNTSPIATGPEPSPARRLTLLVSSTAARFSNEPPIPPTKTENEAYAQAMGRFRKKEARIDSYRLLLAGISPLALASSLASSRPILATTFAVIVLFFLFHRASAGHAPTAPVARRVNPYRKAVDLIVEQLVAEGRYTKTEDAFTAVFDALVWDREQALTGKHFAIMNAGYYRRESRSSRHYDARQAISEQLGITFDPYEDR